MNAASVQLQLAFRAAVAVHSFPRARTHQSRMCCATILLVSYCLSPKARGTSLRFVDLC